jgi:hypothetical protein
MSEDRPAYGPDRSGATFLDHWLFAVCVVFGLAGLLWVVVGSFDPFGLWDGMLAKAFYDGRTPESVDRFRRFILGPFGATNAGCFVALALIARFPFRRREPWAFAAIAGAIGLWFVVDSAASIAHGAAFNVWLVNVPCVVLLGVPLIGLYSRFRSPAG